MSLRFGFLHTLGGRQTAPRDDETEVSGHKANEVQALIDAIGHTGAVNAQRLRDQEP
jgi:hypothetical protein